MQYPIESQKPIQYRGWTIIPQRLMGGDWVVWWHLNERGEHFQKGLKTGEEAVAAGKEGVDNAIGNPSNLG
jgi:hypothetical protein